MAGQTQEPAFRSLLQAGRALSVSSSANSPDNLREALRTASSILPEWRSRSAWNEYGDLHTSGSDDSALLDTIGQRSLDVLVSLQAWLGLLNGELPSESERADLSLGETDRGVIKQLAAQVLSFSLLPSTLSHVQGLNANRLSMEDNARFSTLLSSALGLLCSKPAQSTNKPYPSRPRSATPLTFITQALRDSHLAELVLSAIVLAYSPTRHAEVHHDLKRQVEVLLTDTLRAQDATRGLCSALRIIQSPPTAIAGRDNQTSPMSADSIGTWPDYVMKTVQEMVDRQLERPNGFESYMDMTIAQAVSESDGVALYDRTLKELSGLVSKAPKSIPEDVFTEGVIDFLFHIIRARKGEAPHPRAHTQAVSHIMYAMRRKYPEAVDTFVLTYLDFSFMPQIKPDHAQRCRAGEAVTIMSSDMLETSVDILWSLVDLAPPDPEYAQFLVADCLTVLYVICQTISQGGGTRPEPGLEIMVSNPPLDVACHRILYVWARRVGRETAQAALRRAQSRSAAFRGRHIPSAFDLPDDLAVVCEQQGTSVALVLVEKKSQPDGNGHDGQEALSSLFEYLELL